jgi:phosphoglucomutase
MLVCEVANHLKKQGLTMLDRLNELYRKYGDFKTALLTYEFPGVEGMNTIKSIMSFFRDESIKEQINDIDHIGDYLEGYIHYVDRKEATGLPKSDVVKFFLKDHSTITIRPSGTEPKLKIYIFANGQKRVDELKDVFEGFIK